MLRVPQVPFDPPRAAAEEAEAAGGGSEQGQVGEWEVRCGDGGEEIYVNTRTGKAQLNMPPALGRDAM